MNGHEVSEKEWNYVVLNQQEGGEHLQKYLFRKESFWNLQY